MYVFILWEEHVVSQGKGRHVVQYYLKDTTGELILAVVGTERSTRHTLHVVSEDYLDAFGHTRKEVMEWLTFFISNHHQSPPISGENILLEIQRKNVRTSGDWVDNKWVEVERKKDIKLFISSSLTYVSTCSINEPENCKNHMAPRVGAPDTTSGLKVVGVGCLY